ncbi:Uncaracterized surface protein containing fasciclin (FAS1) repeats [Maribacter dokdonensis]|uniref:Uncaracterized surface protein containing fasciclin (FAS1) repeats n=1 Tax=Maribacter dokdonensis TaxID=320912 RepID=A0ABY0UCB3_9FLAO|nr:fasciclin domain-containing protein [Maribacter dokdonensis]SDS43237.1 Uncaracterized surface protein containing fasciclin (FAS1) repeats [Maribacter dokdonensis]
MKTRNIKNFALMTFAVLAFASCNDQKKKDADKKAMEEKVAMEEAEMKAEETRKQEEAKKKEMMATSIAAVASKNEELSTLVSALKAADLDQMLSEPGSYTVFAPSNNAFEKLPKKMSIAELGKPENKEMLTQVLQYHVVSGVITSDKLVEAINGANGKYTFTTVGGKDLTASLKGDKINLKDEKGNRTEIVLGNVEASNGVVHVTNDVLIMK